MGAKHILLTKPTALLKHTYHEDYTYDFHHIYKYQV